MSVIRTALLLSLVWMVLPAHAQEVRYIIRHARQLLDDKTVRSYHEPYTQVSSAGVLVNRCAEALTISEDLQHFIHTSFITIGGDYIKAFDDAFRARTGAPSTKALMGEYVDHVRAVQKKAVENMVVVIEQKGCDAFHNRKILEYFEHTRLQQKHEASATTEPTAQEDASPHVAEPNIGS